MANDFTKLSYEELEGLVNGHRDGDSSATGRLLEAWERWLRKYINLVRYGRLNMEDKNIRDFISLYMPTEQRRRIHQFVKNAYARIDMEKTVDVIRTIFKDLEYHEIENEVKIAFLSLARRYRSHGNYFHIYINKSFHYQLHRQLKAVANMETVAAIDGSHLTYWDDISKGDSGEYADQYNEAQYSLFYIHEADDEINENWINGLTTSEGFDELTRTQRRILKMYYVEGHTDGEIADKMGTCRATVNRRRQKAIVNIQPYFEQQSAIMK